MRLLRKEEHNTLQQEVHTKTVALNKSNQMNSRINHEFGKLVAEKNRMEGKMQRLEEALERSQTALGKLQAHSAAMDGAVKHLCGAMLAGLGNELDAGRLREFVATVAPLLGSIPKVNHPARLEV
jgi:predicted nuclease with TOPRIM domain